MDTHTDNNEICINSKHQKLMEKHKDIFFRFLPNFALELMKNYFSIDEEDTKSFRCEVECESNFLCLEHFFLNGSYLHHRTHIMPWCG